MIGAGMAGLTAAHALAEAGANVVVLEARERIGGRLYTRRDLADTPVELGGELIHGRGAATWALVAGEPPVKTAELPHVEDEGTTKAPSIKEVDFASLPTPLQTENLAEYIDRAGLGGEHLPDELRYMDMDEEPLRLMSAAYVMQWYRGSVESGELYGEHDFRIPGGYDQLLEPLAKGLNIQLGARVERIDWSDSEHVTVSYFQAGQVHTATARAVVCTLPVGVLQHNDVQFVPALPAEKFEAMHAVSTVDIAKLIYVFDEHVLPEVTGQLFAQDQNPSMWWNGTFGNSMATGDIVIGWAAGTKARELLAMDYAAALEYGCKSLGAILRKPDLKPKVQIMHNWAGDPYARGAYSFVPPGVAASVHDELAKPTANKIFWAGEATNGKNPSTVHGAYESGLRAATEARSALGLS